MTLYDFGPWTTFNIGFLSRLNVIVDFFFYITMRIQKALFQTTSKLKNHNKHIENKAKSHTWIWTKLTKTFIKLLHNSSNTDVASSANSNDEYSQRKYQKLDIMMFW